MIVAGRKLLRALLALGDCATIAASFVGACFTVRLLFHYEFISLARYVWLLGPIVAIWLVCLRIFGFYGSAAYTSRGTLVSRLVQTHFIAGLLLFSAMYLMRAEAVSRLLLHTFLAISVALFTVQKLALRAYLDPTRRSMRYQRRRILLVSTPASAERYLHQIRAHASMTADVEGYAVGGGAALAMVCDLRYGGASAKLGMPIARTVGNCLSMANYARLLDLVGAGPTRELLYRARLRTAEEAKALGLLNEVVPEGHAYEHALKTAMEIAEHAPLTLQVTKEAIRRLQDHRRAVDGDDLVARVYGSDDFREGVSAFLERRKPLFRGR